MNIVVIDDDKQLTDIFAKHLDEAGHQARPAYTAAAGLALAREMDADLVLCDLGLPDMNGLAMIPLLAKHLPRAKIIMLTGGRNTADAVAAMKAGAEDYLEKPLSVVELLLVVEKLGRRRKTELALGNLQKTATRESLERLKVYIGEGMQKVYDDLAIAAAEIRVPVLLLGETGAGKEHAARLLHQLSSHFAGPFVELNCASLPEALVESELFGSEAGSFTDSKQLRRGLFEAAQGGTLFLDEVAELSHSTQAKLLKVLEDHELRRVGANEAVKLNLRVVAATNKDLEAEAKAGRFRPDLYYRLNAFTVSLPALRQRRTDIPELARFLFNRACLDFGRHLEPLDAAELAELKARDWPGNVRELRNVIEGAVLRSKEGRAVFGPGSSRATTEPVIDAVEGQAEAPLRPLHEAVDEAVQRIKRDLLTRALRQSKGNKMEAARLLQIDYKTISNLQKSLGVD